MALAWLKPFFFTVEIYPRFRQIILAPDSDLNPPDRKAVFVLGKAIGSLESGTGTNRGAGDAAVRGGEPGKAAGSEKTGLFSFY